MTSKATGGNNRIRRLATAAADLPLVASVAVVVVVVSALSIVIRSGAPRSLRPVTHLSEPSFTFFLFLWASVTEGLQRRL